MRHLPRIPRSGCTGSGLPAPYLPEPVEGKVRGATGAREYTRCYSSDIPILIFLFHEKITERRQLYQILTKKTTLVCEFRLRFATLPVMPSLLTPISALPKVTADVAEKFKALGVETVRDALFHFPIRHQDWRRLVSIADVQPGEAVTILGTIVSIRGRRAWRRKTHVTEAVVTDQSDATLSVVWFNQPYLAAWLKPSQQWFLSGKVTAKKQKLTLQQPMYERPAFGSDFSATSSKPSGAQARRGARPTHQSLVPVYPATAGLSQWQIRKVLKLAIGYAEFLPEMLPAEIIQAHDLMGRFEAMQQIHFPTSPETAAAAVRRLKFDELVTWQLRWRLAQSEEQQHPAPAIPFREAEIRSFVQHLPFNLTRDQRLAAWEIIQDLTKPEPMSRLLQGDVGSGKTIVAAIAAYHAIHNGYQVAFLAPTLVLAQQHFRTLCGVLAKTDVSLGLLTGSASLDSRSPEPVARADLLTNVANGQIHFLVGTHAMFQSQTDWHQLGLVIVDEQQRFGVEQRQALLERQISAGRPMPHFLSLTATPIPRTLALFFAGELAISSLHQKPPGRIPIRSEVIGPDQRGLLDRALTDTVKRQEQVYVITPLIEESDALGVRAATTEFERLRATWPTIRCGLLHGSLDPDERVATLDRFRRHELDVLVSTTVIEVGVDVPNATLIVIEGAERFGLAQLHQLRGRVGRGERPSRCLFVTEQPTQPVLARLGRVAETDDGLALAELDLELRGAGDLYGLRQSGLPDWRLASLQDRELMQLARQAADRILSDHPAVLTTSAWQAALAWSPAYHRE